VEGKGRERKKYVGSKKEVRGREGERGTGNV